MSRWGPPAEPGQGFSDAQVAEAAAHAAQAAQLSAHAAHLAAQPDRLQQLSIQQQQEHLMIQLAQAQLAQQAGVQQTAPAVPEWKRIAFQALGAAQGAGPATFDLPSSTTSWDMALGNSAASAPKGAKRARGCWFYGQGQCAKGAACQFSHDPDAVALTCIQENFEIPTCWYYEKGMCSKGKYCTFQHQGNIPQSKTAKVDISTEEPDDDIYTAVKVALTAALTFEGETAVRKMRVKISKYCHDSVQGLMNLGGPASVLINEYADNLFSLIFQGFGDRPWITQMDFLLVLDAAVKELLPKPVLQGMTFEETENIIFTAHDRALDEQRSGPMVWEVVQQVVQGPKTRKKVFQACEAGRKAAAGKEGLFGAEEFARIWISTCVAQLRRECAGYPEATLPRDTCTQLFNACFDAGGLPEARLKEGWPSATGWVPFVTDFVASTYAQGQPPALPPTTSSWDCWDKGKGYGKGKDPWSDPWSNPWYEGPAQDDWAMWGKGKGKW